MLILLEKSDYLVLERLSISKYLLISLQSLISARDCPPGYFTCNSGLCIHGAFRCDGVRDCLYNEDELNCGEP